MFNLSLNLLSIIKQSGALISSRLIPPKDGSRLAIISEILSGSFSFISMSIESTSANLLNNTALPSITGLEAKGPRSPNPRIAEPFDITATRLPLAV